MTDHGLRPLPLDSSLAFNTSRTFFETSLPRMAATSYIAVFGNVVKLPLPYFFARTLARTACAAAPFFQTMMSLLTAATSSRNKCFTASVCITASTASYIKKSLSHVSTAVTRFFEGRSIQANVGVELKGVS
jgi:hypothetical protein